jgi:hypothetical protein
MKHSALFIGLALATSLMIVANPATVPFASAGQGGTWTIQDGGVSTLIGQAQNNLTVNVKNNGPDDIEVVIGPPDKTTRVKAGATAILPVQVGQSVRVRDANPGNGRGASGRYRAS